MALKKCKECSAEVSSKAEACPKCGAKLKRKVGCVTKIIVLLLILFAVGSMLNSIAPKSDSSPGNNAAKRSIAELKEAAEQGDPEAQYELSEAYFVGEGVAKNRTVSTNWCRRAAEQGHVRAQFALGLAYASGDGVQINKIEAVNWWMKAAEQGDAAAQRNLGVCFRDGSGVPISKSEAVKWWMKAAEQGDEDSWYHLGLSYKDGAGVSKDYIEAYKWIYLSWDPKIPGDWSATDLRDLERVMTSDQIKEAKRRANEWRSAHTK